MSQGKEVIFVNGLIFKEPKPGAPEFIRGSISIKADEFAEFIRTHAKNGWVNIDVMESRGGKVYCKLNTYERQSFGPRRTTEREDREYDRAFDAQQEEYSRGY